MLGDKVSRLRFITLPTPIQPLPRLSESLGGPEIWVKRDDLTGLAFGGNKTRKLEFLLGDARSQGAETLITRGAVQSNHCRQTAAAAAKFGFDCVLVLAGEPPSTPQGNLLLDHLLGARPIFTQGKNPEQTLEDTYAQLQTDDRKPYLIPYGGSNPVGVLGYIEAMQEFILQAVPIDHIFLASSSGGTQAGLILGSILHGFKGKITGISVDLSADALRKRVANLVNQTAEWWGYSLEIGLEEVDVIDSYIGAGYGVFGTLEREAIKLFAQTEGLLLDPVYTGRAAGGMLDLIRREIIPPDESVLFWHTGGTPSLFAYAPEFVR